MVSLLPLCPTRAAEGPVVVTVSSGCGGKMRSDKKERDRWWKRSTNLPNGWGWQLHSPGPRQGILRSRDKSLSGLTSRKWTSSPHSSFFWRMLFHIQSGVWMLPPRAPVQVAMLLDLRDVTPWEARASTPYRHVGSNACTHIWHVWPHLVTSNLRGPEPAKGKWWSSGLLGNCKAWCSVGLSTFMHTPLELDERSLYSDSSHSSMIGTECKNHYYWK